MEKCWNLKRKWERERQRDRKREAERERDRERERQRQRQRERQRQMKMRQKERDENDSKEGDRGRYTMRKRDHYNTRVDFHDRKYKTCLNTIQAQVTTHKEHYNYV